MSKRLHIIEPTLENEAGHCHSFVESLCGAWARRGDAYALTVWAGIGARLPGLDAKGVVVRPYFHRRIRRLQEFLLIARLLRLPCRIFIPTAGRMDLLILRLAAHTPIPPAKVFLFVHWFRPTAGKREAFRKAARRLPQVHVMGPTESVASVFRECGFANAEVVPYPISAQRPGHFPSGMGFRHLVYAGAARQDKGFSIIVGLVEALADSRSDIPVAVQASADHYDKLDPRSKSDLERLQGVRYPALRVYPDTLEGDAYADLFRGGICLQPYDREDFADRVSGVTLDALSAGCPVVATAGTWIARTVRRFDAGKVLEDLSPPAILSAVDAVRSDYARYRDNARAAGRSLQEENDAGKLYEALTRETGRA